MEPNQDQIEEQLTLLRSKSDLSAKDLATAEKLIKLEVPSSPDARSREINRTLDGLCDRTGLPPLVVRQATESLPIKRIQLLTRIRAGLMLALLCVTPFYPLIPAYVMWNWVTFSIERAALECWMVGLAVAAIIVLIIYAMYISRLKRNVAQQLRESNVAASLLAGHSDAFQVSLRVPFLVRAICFRNLPISIERSVVFVANNLDWFLWPRKCFIRFSWFAIIFWIMIWTASPIAVEIYEYKTRAVQHVFSMHMQMISITVMTYALFAVLVESECRRLFVSHFVPYMRERLHG